MANPVRGGIERVWTVHSTVGSAPGRGGHMSIFSKFSLAPGFSPVSGHLATPSAALAAYRDLTIEKTVKNRFRLSYALNTRLKPGANESGSAVETDRKVPGRGCVFAVVPSPVAQVCRLSVSRRIVARVANFLTTDFCFPR